MLIVTDEGSKDDEYSQDFICTDIYRLSRETRHLIFHQCLCINTKQNLSTTRKSILYDAKILHSVLYLDQMDAKELLYRFQGNMQTA